MSFTVDTNVPEVMSQLAKRSRQIPFATSLALTRIAHQIRDAQKLEMRAVFDRPTPFTMNAFQVVPAVKARLVSEVRYKDELNSTSPNHYLETQVRGGVRPKKRYEMRIGAALNQYSFAAIIPTRNANRDRYGNWSAGQRMKVLSALTAQGDVLSNETAASRKRNPKRATYYVGTRGSLTGVFRSRRSVEDDLILMFVKTTPIYHSRFAFHGVAKRAFDLNWRTTFDAAMTRAIQTARPGA